MNNVVVTGRLNDNVIFDESGDAFFTIRDRSNIYGTNFFRCRAKIEMFEDLLKTMKKGEFYQITGYLYQSKKLQTFIQACDFEKISLVLDDLNIQELNEIVASQY